MGAEGEIENHHIQRRSGNGPQLSGFSAQATSYPVPTEETPQLGQKEGGLEKRTLQKNFLNLCEILCETAFLTKSYILPSTEKKICGSKTNKSHH